MADKIFIDTSSFFAFLNKSDTYHEEAKKQFSSSAFKITSNYVFDELMTLLTSRGKKSMSISFGEQLRSETLVDYHFFTLAEEEKAWEIYKKFRDHDLSFTDCTTLTFLKDQKNLRLLSFDRTLLKVAKQFE